VRTPDLSILKKGREFGRMESVGACVVLCSSVHVMDVNLSAYP